MAEEEPTLDELGEFEKALLLELERCGSFSHAPGQKLAVGVQLEGYPPIFRGGIRATAVLCVDDLSEFKSRGWDSRCMSFIRQEDANFKAALVETQLSFAIHAKLLEDYYAGKPGLPGRLALLSDNRLESGLRETVLQLLWDAAATSSLVLFLDGGPEIFCPEQLVLKWAAAG